MTSITKYVRHCQYLQYKSFFTLWITVTKRVIEFSVYFGFNIHSGFTLSPRFWKLSKHTTNLLKSTQHTKFTSAFPLCWCMMEFCQSGDTPLSIPTNKLTVISCMSINYSSKHHVARARPSAEGKRANEEEAN